ncbi:MAG: hypothetical protein ACRCX2_09665 [Paraclostridium sp.]
MKTNIYTMKGLNSFEKEQVEKVFKKCYGLQSALQKTNDMLLRRGAIEALAFQSGLRKEFIEDNLEEILNY